MKIKNILIVFGLTICSFMFCCGFSFFDKIFSKSENSAQTYSQLKNNLWCVTFQLVWNDFMDKFADGNPVIFENGNPQIAKQLNKRLYTKDILNSNSYYITQGFLSERLKDEIETAILEKFNEKSDLLNFVDWTRKDSYLFYAMLKKDFAYPVEFDKLKPTAFNNSIQKVNYFGIDTNSPTKARNFVDVLFYNSSNDFAVKLQTTQGEDVILFRTNKKSDFEKLYAYVEKNLDIESFGKKDTLKIPEINIDELISYNELVGKKIKNKNYTIGQALQTIKFKLDNKGGSLKSEAIITVMRTMLTPDKPARNFVFDKQFVLFLKESSSNKPYFAVRINNLDFLINH